MSTRPIIVVAATSETVAAGIAGRCLQMRRDYGVDLRVGASDTVNTFQDKDELFSFLGDLGPLALLDTLVIVHIGPHYEECFAPRLRSRRSGWHGKYMSNQGIGLELMLRFPQVFPVFTFSPSGVESFDEWLAGWMAGTNRSTDHMLRDWAALTFANPLGDIDDFHRLERILRRFLNGLRTYFDPTGLRTVIRNRFLGEVFGSENDWSNSQDGRDVLNERLDNLVVPIDEELELSLLAGYAAYKFGARAWMITNYKSLIDRETPCWNDDHTPNLTIVRDLDLRFNDIHDQPIGEKALAGIRDALVNINSPIWNETITLPSRCKVRVLSYDPNVKESRRQFVGKELAVGQKTRASLDKNKPCQFEFYGLKKPIRSIYSFSSILDFCNGSPLLPRLSPPSAMGGVEGHGAPYQNLRIAQELLEQAALYRSLHEVRASVIAALLGEEAYSLLLGMSKTSCLEAVREIHLAEAATEGEFAGVSHAVDSRERRADLERTARKLQLDDGGRSFLARIWAELRLVYKLSEQFEASEEANAESLVNSVWIARWLNSWSFSRFVKRVLVMPFRSLSYLLAVVLGIPAILTLLYCLLYGWVFSPNWAGIVSLVDLYHHVLVSVIRPAPLNAHGIIAGQDESFWKELLDVGMSATSVLFVGMIVTVLFRKSTRG